MTPEQLAASCQRGCGRTVGEHAAGESRDDCAWINSAMQSTWYDARTITDQGRWSNDHFEAYDRLHVATVGRIGVVRAPRQDEPSDRVARLVRLLDNAIENHRAGRPHMAGTHEIKRFTFDVD